MGLAYTLAKGEGWTGWNPDILAADPTGELNRIHFWGPTGNNRTHNLNVNYSYMIPNAAAGHAGGQVDPARLAGLGRHAVPERQCDAAGLQHDQHAASPTRNPTLTPGVTAKCVFTGEGIYDMTRDPNLPEEDQLHFNPRAFTMAQPFSATVGNFGNVPDGILRNPSWYELGPDAGPPLPGAGSSAAMRRRACSCSSTTSSTRCSSPR